MLDHHIIARAKDLHRNDRVVRYLGELPYLVDHAHVQPDGNILVEFSSGDEIPYEPDAAVIVRES